MALALLQSIFCSCCRGKEQAQIHDLYDETTHLIPEEIEPPVNYSNVNLVDYQKLQERLTEIVRSKQSKMVNVASRIPFNLHNQVIPQAQSGSRSTSRSIDDRYDSRYYSNHSDYQHPNYDYRPRVNTFARGNDGRSHSPSPHAGPSTSNQPQEDITEQPKPTPILNIRLVGYKDTEFRGRTRARGPVPSGLPFLSQLKPQLGDGTTPVASNFPTIEVSTPTQEQPIPVFKLENPVPMTISWGD